MVSVLTVCQFRAVFESNISFSCQLDDKKERYFVAELCISLNYSNWCF